MTQEANEPRGDDRQSLETAGIEPMSANPPIAIGQEEPHHRFQLPADDLGDHEALRNLGVEEAWRGAVEGREYGVLRVLDDRGIYLVQDEQGTTIFSFQQGYAGAPLTSADIEHAVRDYFEHEAGKAVQSEIKHQERIRHHEEALATAREHLTQAVFIGPIEEAIKYAGLAYARETALQAARTAHRRGRSPLVSLSTGPECVAISLTALEVSAYCDFIEAIDGHPFDEAFPILAELSNKIAMADTRTLVMEYEKPGPFSTYTKDSHVALELPPHPADNPNGPLTVWDVFEIPTVGEQATHIQKLWEAEHPDSPLHTEALIAHELETLNQALPEGLSIDGPEATHITGDRTGLPPGWHRGPWEEYNYPAESLADGWDYDTYRRTFTQEHVLAWQSQGNEGYPPHPLTQLVTPTPTSEAARRAIGYAYQSKDFVDKYSSEALSLMERLWQDVRGFHDGPYLIPADSPLPSWFMEAVRAIPNRGVEAGWPQFARYWEPVNWPALVAAHPGEAVWERPEYAAMYTDLWDWGTREGLDPRFDVGVFIAEDARIEVSVWAFNLGEHKNAPALSLEQTRGVERILASHKYPDAWQHDDSPAQWELT